ncbi:MAG: phosphoenolpyruvate carboxykinase (GTP) [Promethearchaeota archaeon]
MSLDPENLAKLQALNNEHVLKEVNYYLKILKPDKVYVITDSKEDIEFVRNRAIEVGEESRLKMEGHTVHFDGVNDQARDVANTRILVTKDMEMSTVLNTKDRDEGLKEIFEILDGIMKGKELLIRFFVLGPKNSKFTLYALQLTDSYYVAHSEDLLYRQGYNEFKKLNGSDKFFVFVHSAGELEGNVSKNVDKRRIYIDLIGNRVLSVNNQYAGNSLGLKKLALRLAIHKSNNEDWLTEHMFIMGLIHPSKHRVTYACGAYPSMCGKTSTAMLPGMKIVGDDIAYLRNINGECRAVNIEKGIFGIIKDVNPTDDPMIYKALTTPGEVIFSNVLVKDGVPYWTGMGKEIPNEGINFTGKWYKGKKDKNGKEIPPSHKNSRYTLSLSKLENADLDGLENPNGVPIDLIFYGGRDSDTNVPIYQSFDWEHGVFIGATLESESTAATLGKEGQRKWSPMANLDFVVVPLNKYFENYRVFGQKLKNKAPKVFATNYFLKENGKYLNDKLDKKVWVLWAEGRVHGEYDAIKTPVGYIPKYDDLKQLFKEVLNKEYKKEDYKKQFTIRCRKILEKLDRMKEHFKREKVQGFLPEIIDKIYKETSDYIKKFGEENISPFKLIE